MRLRSHSKYHNVKVVIDGFVFDSKAEAHRYGELRLLEKAGEIRRLTVHPKYPLKIDDVHLCNYIGDFSYEEEVPDMSPGFRAWRPVIEDVKGVRTAFYRLKKKLFEALHPGFKITEISVKRV